MARVAFDPVTMTKALALATKHLGIDNWSKGALQPLQGMLQEAMRMHGDNLLGRVDLPAMASTSADALNQLLEDNGFGRLIEPFDGTTCIGIVTLIKIATEWLLGPANTVEIETERGLMKGFALPKEGVRVYQLTGLPGAHLLELRTLSEDTAWLLTGVELPQSKDALFALVQKAYTAYRTQVPYAGVHVPVFKFNQISPLPELIGMVGTASTAQWTITQAKQQLYVDMNPLGVEAGAASTLVVYRSFSFETPFKVNQPAVGFFTREGIPMPLIAYCMEWNDFQSV